jgi:hypothetical protein
MSSLQALTERFPGQTKNARTTNLDTLISEASSLMERLSKNPTQSDKARFFQTLNAISKIFQTWTPTELKRVLEELERRDSNKWKIAPIEIFNSKTGEFIEMIGYDTKRILSLDESVPRTDTTPAILEREKVLVQIYGITLSVIDRISRLNL